MEVHSDVLELIVSKLDNNSIKNLSLVPGIWSEISLFARDQHFWFLRTEELIGRHLSWKEDNWKEAYYILSSSLTKIDNDSDNPIAASIVLSLGANPVTYSNESIRSASKNGHVNIVRLLLQDGRVDPSAVRNEAIKEASEYGHAEVIKLLLADPRVGPIAVDNSPIKSAAKNGHTEVVRLLLEDGRADPSLLRNIILVGASTRGYIDIVRLLLQDKRVYAEGLVRFAGTARGRASKNGHQEVVDLLEEWMEEHKNSW